MNKVFDIGKFDLDVTLRDAALDPNLSRDNQGEKARQSR